MKNIFKYLGAFAIVGALGFNTLNVSAETTCAADEKVHTNYYLFHNVDPAEDYETGINGTPEGQFYTIWTGSDKYNNIKKATIIDDGSVTIQRDNLETSPGAPEKWSVADYWLKYYTANLNKDENLTYTDGDVTYLLHDKWWVYEENFQDGIEYTHTTTELEDALMGYISGNKTSLANSTLVKYGSSLPSTKVTVPSNIDTSSENSLRWHVSRSYTGTDILAGVTLIGKQVIYSPAAYYVKFCVKDTSSTGEKTITYDQNTSDYVVGMPGTNTFSDECTNISASEPVRNGYTFVGWSKDPSSTTADYKANASYCGDSVVLHAVWVKNDSAQTGFTVTYDANGGKDAPSAQSAVGKCVTISSDKPIQTGNNFLGWSRDKNAREPDANYAAGKEYCGEDGSITLYAVWQTQTGVGAHFITFSIVAVAAGAALVVARKKNLFKQI